MKVKWQQFNASSKHNNIINDTKLISLFRRPVSIVSGTWPFTLSFAILADAIKIIKVSPIHVSMAVYFPVCHDFCYTALLWKTWLLSLTGKWLKSPFTWQTLALIYELVNANNVLFFEVFRIQYTTPLWTTLVQCVACLAFDRKIAASAWIQIQPGPHVLSTGEKLLYSRRLVLVGLRTRPRGRIKQVMNFHYNQ